MIGSHLVTCFYDTVLFDTRACSVEYNSVTPQFMILLKKSESFLSLDWFSFLISEQQCTENNNIIQCYVNQS